MRTSPRTVAGIVGGISCVPMPSVALVPRAKEVAEEELQ